MNVRQLVKLFEGDYVTVDNIAQKTFYTTEEVEKRLRRLEEQGYVEEVGTGRYIPKREITIDDLRNEFFSEFEELK